MKKLVKLIRILFLIFVLVVVLFLGYMGFLPGISSFLGSDKPRDLAVRFTQEDLNGAQSKLGQKIVEPEGDSYQQLKSTEGKLTEVFMNQEEFSAHVQVIHPVSDLQIKLSGSAFELSGRLKRSRIPRFLQTWGMTDVSDMEILNTFYKYLLVDPIFYLAGTGSVENNLLTIDLTRAELGRLPVPTAKAEQTLKSYLESLFTAVPGFSVEDSYIVDGELYFKGWVVEEIPNY